MVLIPRLRSAVGLNRASWLWLRLKMESVFYTGCTGDENQQ